ncbi:putative receptor protein kinase ZmPK1 [Bidens hawaiensis]|uniref:putative receptor protein kinase ZmPK1 n=1 Tax=Bidens hawaiensis TaxID=980011 RepID=UPI00404AF095
MANRDAPVNGKKSRLSLQKDGNLVLIDAGQHVIWSTQTQSKSSSLELKLKNTGNLVLALQQQQQQQHVLWQSFDYPTDTLLPNQPFTRNTQLVSSRSSTNYSSGYYKLIFDHDSILRLIYDNLETTSNYWPDPKIRTYYAGRFEYIDARTAQLDSYGLFNSTDGFSFTTTDYGLGPQRMMRLDTDGNVRAYTQAGIGMKWEVTWQAISQICRIDGTCGPNSLCTYSNYGRKCSCLHGFKMAHSQDWSAGCEPDQSMDCKEDGCDFIALPYAEFYGYDIRFHVNTTLDACKKDCLHDNNCRGFNFAYLSDKGFFCFLKSSLHNGYQNGVYSTIYIKMPTRLASSFNNRKAVGRSSFTCPRPVVTLLARPYEKINDTRPLGFMVVVGCTIGFMEIVCILFFWYCSSKHSSTVDQLYFPASTGFRKFTYHELKKASHNFSEEIGKGGASVVYKARLKDNRIAAIKKLKNSGEQGEDEFQAEISTIGRMNHMNLIETWGYCAEGNNRLVVYEYMENGSLANNLRLGKLDWATRFNIVLGTAKGLAYLHEECLEWILHCDVKPHNILLDGDYNPKVGDFGLSKRWDRGGSDQWKFSVMRGTRGYMAPEWVLNLAITSKVDVFSYGVVVLEMIAGKGPGDGGLIDWVRGRWVDRVEDIVDASIRGEYDPVMMENLVRIALQCTEEDSEARPTMSNVVSMLLQIL